MVTIKADLSALSKDQREALCGFILNFPPAQLVEEDPEVNNEAITTAPTPSEAFGNTLQVTTVPTPPVVTNGQIAASGPVLVVPPAAEAQSSVITDKAGLPWDDRIHSSSKGQTADGFWRKKRSVSEQEFATVEAELRKLMNLPTPPPAADSAPEPPKTLEPVTAIPVPSNVQIVPPPPPAAAPPAVPANDRQAFVALVAKASGAISNGKMTSEELNSIVKSLGIESLQLLVNRLDLVPQVSTMIDLQLQGR
jgi:hypothetical protein